MPVQLRGVALLPVYKYCPDFLLCVFRNPHRFFRLFQMKERVKVFGGTSTTRSGITTGTERVHYILLLPTIYYLHHMHKSCQSEEISCSSLLWTALSCSASCRVRCGASFFFGQKRQQPGHVGAPPSSLLPPFFDSKGHHLINLT